MTYSNMLGVAKQLAKDTGDRIIALETNYTFYPYEIALINESKSARTIAAVTSCVTTDFLMVTSDGRSLREMTQKVIDSLNTDKNCQFISTGVEMEFDECKVTDIKLIVNDQTLSVIAEVSKLDLYWSGDVLADYLKLYLLIVSKITKLSVGELRMDVRDVYVLKKDVNEIQEMSNDNMVEVVLADTLTDLNFTADDISLKT